MSADPTASDAVAVIASGNLSLAWFTGLPGRTRLEEIQRRWPDLVAGLAAHRAIGVVVVDSERGLVAVGGKGVRELEPGEGRVPDVEGTDPLLAYPEPEVTARDLVRAARLQHTGDLLIVSTVAPNGHIHAFEHQVGSHGGIGGEQNLPLFLTPTSLRRTHGELIGADAVYRQVRAWQEELGLRSPASTSGSLVRE